MTAEQTLALIGNISTILRTLGSWPIGVTILVVAVGPWIAMFLLDRAQSKRFEKVVEMYENNVELVNDYREVAKNLQDLVIVNTQVLTEVLNTARHNLFCPLARDSVKPKGPTT